ncbi:hypothetical protein TTHT_1738 [Thermotomaculum hydrothermale]|uniref:Tetratricopeptide repeat protein n=1 Tax=Thermotomaculum hydrothermale TaxID=981385 RepID=A0A7R6SYW0_9BACT|nr:tetratricopeptide repeat protein [Thermotomaculum hydrothermale]BBB33209.1 hypothetical protein TTHT_1738 [Thermotomaculum hydrothermale]
MKRVFLIVNVIILILISAIWGMRFFSEKENLYSTKNKEALKHYKAGVNYTMMYYVPEARKEFALAIKKDPNFPLPYIFQIMMSRGLKGSNIPDYYKKIAVPQKNWTEFEKEFTSIFLEYTAKREKIKGDRKFAKRIENFIDKYADRIEIYPIILPMYQTAIGDTNKLIKYYEYLHEKFPNNTQIINRLGYLYLQKKEYKKAENAFKKYIFIEPDNANPYDSIADLYYTQGNYKKAIENYQKALSIKPDFPNSKIKLALCYIFTGKLKLAEKKLNEILELKNTIPYLTFSAYNIKAILYLLEGETEKIKELYQSFNPPKDYFCFKLPIQAFYGYSIKDKNLLSKAIENSEKCPHFIRQLIAPLKIPLLIWLGKENQAEKLIQSILQKINDLTYDRKVFYINLIADYYLEKKEYSKIEKLLPYLNEKDKAYLELLMAKSQNNKEKCKEFAKKLLQYYNEADENFYKKKEALKCLK